MRQHLLLLTTIALCIWPAPGLGAEYTRSITDGSTPPGLAPGAPAGAYPLSGFESVNFFSGNLNFSLPLLEIGGRGEAGYTMMLRIKHPWRVESQVLCVGPTCQPTDIRHDVVPTWWNSFDVGYGPGNLMVRTGAEIVPCANNPDTTVQDQVLTRLSFTMPDGTEQEFRDKDTDGKPHLNTARYLTPCTGETPTARGTEFVTADGSAATFSSNTAFLDAASVNPQEGGYESLGGTGQLATRNGIFYEITNGKVARIRDRNGNVVSFVYDGLSRVTQITDSLNRVVTVTYDNPGANGTTYDQISFRGFQGNVRTIKVRKSSLQATLNGGTTQTFDQLFPQNELNPQLLNPPPNPTLFNPSDVISSVELPDGRSYTFKYNAYQELVRVQLPTGGVLEYAHGPGTGAGASGIYHGAYSMIYRVVKERRVLSDGVALEGKTLFTDQIIPTAGIAVTASHQNASGAVLASEQHFFYDHPTTSGGIPPFAYPVWRTGKEYRTDHGNLRRTDHAWLQRSCSSWYPLGGAPCSIPGQEPEIDPRIVETRTTLLDTNQVSTQTFTYDQYNNRLDVSEYDYGPGAPGVLKRRTSTEYLTLHEASGANYATDLNIHLRSLPKVRTVYDGNNVEYTQTVYEYDNYTAGDGKHAQLVARPGIVGHASTVSPPPPLLFPSTYTRRGNVTSSARWLNTQTKWVYTYQQFDLAGNVLKSIDPRGFATEWNYSDDRFGVPNGNVLSTTNPPELGSQKAYAFPISVKNARNHETLFKHDYYLGKMVDHQDANGVKSSLFYDDLLDRPTRLEQAIGTIDHRQTTFAYDPDNRLITTTRDRETLNDTNPLKAQLHYDGLGRTDETRQYETASAFITSRTQYDGLGRAWKVSNPYRAGETPVYTETKYDALGRIESIKTPDNAEVTTSYFGHATTVTDPALKARKSETDALGRLTAVYEEPSGQNLATVYSYDPLDNLRKVEQGIQQRYFSYDSLSRLIRARNPEHDINSSLQLPLADPLTNHNQWSISYSYDDNGNLTQKVDPRSVVTTYDPYDELNRVTRWANAGGPAEARSTSEVSFVYDICGGFSLGRRCSLSSKDASGAFFSSTSYLNYRPLGAVGKSVQTVRHQQTDYSYNLEYDYNLLDALKWQKYPSNKKVVTEFDDAGRTAAVKRDDGSPTPHYYVGAAAGSANAARRIDYAPHGAVRRMGLGNGLWDETRFNIRLQPKQIGLGQVGTDPSSDLGSVNSDRLLLQLSYLNQDSGNCANPVANNGNLMQQTIQAPGLSLTQNYCYDPLNRLQIGTESSAGAGWSQTYSYDRFGNRAVTAGSQHGANPSWTPTALSHFDPGSNRLLAPSEYDLAGNLTKDNVGMQFKYDADNKQVEFNPGASLPVTKYFYDGEGRRVKKETTGSSTTLFVYNAQGQLAAEYTSGSPTGSGTSYLTTDHLGSTRIVTDETGLPKTRHDYLPFGEEIPLTATNYGNRLSIPGFTASPIDGPNQKFTSKERDSESNLDYFGARYFSGAQGRFTSPDSPFADQYESDPQSWNLYTYVRNNPLRLTDPTGNACVDNGQGGYKDDGGPGGTCEDALKGDIQIRKKPSITVTEQGPPSPLLLAVALGAQRAETPVRFFFDVTMAFLTTVGPGTIGGAAVELGSVVPNIATFATKAAARQALARLNVTTAQSAAAKSAISRATTSSTIEVLKDGQSVIVRIVRPGANGHQVLESTIDAVGNKTVVQKAYDAAGKLVHFDPK